MNSPDRIWSEKTASSQISYNKGILDINGIRNLISLVILILSKIGRECL